MFELHDFRPGDRVELHPATDLWMRGARFGKVQRVGRKWLAVRVDMLGKVINVAPRNIGAIVE